MHALVRSLGSALRAALAAAVVVCGWALAEAPASEEVTFRSGDVQLAGTLTLPPGAGPHPAVVTISGSGPQTRASEVPGVAGYALFEALAPFLAERGVAVLRYDDRGVGASGGEHATATSYVLAADAEAAVRYLQARSEIDPLWIGLLGHSEGGMIGPMVAARHPGVAFVVALAPPVADALEGFARQERLLLETEGMPPEAVDAQVAATREILELARAGAWEDLERTLRERVQQQLAALPAAQREAFGDVDDASDRLVAQTMTQYRGWMHAFLHHDAQADWARLSVPALAVFGARDVQVDVQVHRAALASVADAGQVDLVTLPDANHLFQAAESGGVGEYATLDPAPAPRLFEALGAWFERALPGAE